MPAPSNIARHSPPTPAAARVDLHTVTDEDDVFYPCSDGKPLADNMWQAEAILNAASELKVARPGALVAMNILMYPERGNPKNRIAPDVLVAFGLGTHNRSSYFTWREGKPPDWVLEVASPRKLGKYRDEKQRAYAAIGVPEYCLFDPQGGLFPHGEARLQGFRLVDGVYRPLAPMVRRGMTAIRSEALALELRVDGELLRFRDLATDKDILHRVEIEAIIRETARADREAAKRKAAQARVAELEAALERVRAGSPFEAP